MKVVDVPWCHDGREIINERGKIEASFRDNFARPRDLSKYKVQVREVLPSAGATKGKPPPRRQVALTDVLDATGRIVYVELVYEGGFQPLWLAVRLDLDGGGGKIVGFID
jgi:hypothetical protein